MARQAEILGLIASGLTDKQIAAKVGVSPRTVQSHVDRLYLQHGLQQTYGVDPRLAARAPG
jgi:DNA-binding NarL/FixJ family response regulator